MVYVTSVIICVYLRHCMTRAVCQVRVKGIWFDVEWRQKAFPLILSASKRRLFFLPDYEQKAFISYTESKRRLFFLYWQGAFVLSCYVQAHLSKYKIYKGGIYLYTDSAFLTWRLFYSVISECIYLNTDKNRSVSICIKNH